MPLTDADRLVDGIRAKGARLAVPGIIDMSELVSGARRGRPHRARGGQAGEDARASNEKQYRSGGTYAHAVGRL